MLDITNRLIVVIGGGAVGLRKVTGLLVAGGAKIRVVAPVLHEQMPSTVERITDKYQPHHLNGATLVFAATNDAAVNEKVTSDARALGILVNRADTDDTDFTTPAILREKSVTITVSSGSPAIAAQIRDQIQKTLDPRWLALAEAMKTLRPAILAADLPEQARRELLREIATEEAADLAAAGNLAALQAKIPMTKSHIPIKSQ